MHEAAEQDHGRGARGEGKRLTAAIAGQRAATGAAGRQLASLLSGIEPGALSVDAEAAGVLLAEALSYVRQHFTNGKQK